MPSAGADTFGDARPRAEHVSSAGASPASPGRRCRPGGGPPRFTRPPRARGGPRMRSLRRADGASGRTRALPAAERRVRTRHKAALATRLPGWPATPKRRRPHHPRDAVLRSAEGPAPTASAVTGLRHHHNQALPLSSLDTLAPLGNPMLPDLVRTVVLIVNRWWSPIGTVRDEVAARRSRGPRRSRQQSGNRTVWTAGFTIVR